MPQLRGCCSNANIFPHPCHWRGLAQQRDNFAGLGALRGGSIACAAAATAAAHLTRAGDAGKPVGPLQHPNMDDPVAAAKREAAQRRQLCTCATRFATAQHVMGLKAAREDKAAREQLQLKIQQLRLKLSKAHDEIAQLTRDLEAAEELCEKQRKQLLHITAEAVQPTAAAAKVRVRTRQPSNIGEGAHALQTSAFDNCCHVCAHVL